MNLSIIGNGHQYPDFGSDMGAMDIPEPKVFNDSVHGHITLHSLLVKVVDTPQFQRLRNLKQLGAGHYVYPGASHCRFEHSLGTCYLAGQIMDRLLTREEQQRTEKEKEKLKLCVQVAALCHDLGHGAFSHTWEEVIKEWGEIWHHEKASTELFDYLLEANNLKEDFAARDLNADEIEMIKELIVGVPHKKRSKKDNFLYEIVNNKETGIDVDKWDYFLRDGLHLNLRITFDYHRLMEFCRVQTAADGRTHIAFRDKEIVNLYDMYRVRSVLHYSAYRHKVVCGIEFMIIEAFKLAGDAGYKLNGKYPLREVHKNPIWLSELTDHILYDILYSCDPNLKKAQDILMRINKRDLYLLVKQKSISLAEVEPRNREREIQAQKNALRQNLINRFPKYDFCVGRFYLHFDTKTDPVSKAHFYHKVKNGNDTEILPRSHAEIKDSMNLLPFQLTSEPAAELLVFCKSRLNEEELREIRNHV